MENPWVGQAAAKASTPTATWAGFTALGCSVIFKPSTHSVANTRSEVNCQFTLVFLCGGPCFWAGQGGFLKVCPTWKQRKERWRHHRRVVWNAFDSKKKMSIQPSWDRKHQTSGQNHQPCQPPRIAQAAVRIAPGNYQSANRTAKSMSHVFHTLRLLPRTELMIEAKWSDYRQLKAHRLPPQIIAIQQQSLFQEHLNIYLGALQISKNIFQTCNGRTSMQ